MLEEDRQHIWHPYSAMGSDNPVYPVESADGVLLHLSDGRVLIDGMSSWWCAIHGYNHPVLNKAIENQLASMSHVMFGGLTHQPAVDLANKLVELTPQPLQYVFFTDSGSVAVEVAMKMAIQYWISKKQSDKCKFISLRKGYHGDTLNAMSVCDPVTGMHSLFNKVLPQQFFVEEPACLFSQACSDDDIAPMRNMLALHHHEVAAVILEPIVQGAGGMRFYAAGYLTRVRELCDEFDVLLIADEIATGFGRTGRLFACEHANITPDIMCAGKSLTGGYMTLAATLTTENIGNTISQGEPGVFMHGPTFMANPLACAVSLASINLLLSTDWQKNIQRIETGLREGLIHCQQYEHVHDVRVLGAIGVVEMKHAVDMKIIQPMFVEEGVWIRPFGKLIYLMPPFIISNEQLTTLSKAVSRIILTLSSMSQS